MGYSQKIVAQLLGRKNPARICDYEQGKIIPSLQTALKLEIILHTPIREFYSNGYKQFQREINHKKKQIFRNAPNK
jgi:transcriptional regulator with XRE-family HTH domain